MFSFESEVRYSELNSDGQLSLGSVVNYLQDCSTFQSESLGIGVHYYKQRRHAWVLNYWQIILRETLHVGDKIRISTWPYEFKGFLGKRNFMIEKDGRRCVEADSLWSFLNLDTLKPERPEADILERYGKEEPLPMEKLSRKIMIPPDSVGMEPFPVRKYHLDTNGHVNNEKYVELAAEYLPDPFCTESLRVEYKKSAFYGDVMSPKVWMDDEKQKVIVDLCDLQGKSYATVEFRSASII